MLYDVSMKISYTYEVGPSGARHVIRVLPLTIPGTQRLIVGTVAVDPAPDERTDPDEPTPGEPESEEAEAEDVSQEPDAGPEAVS